MNFVNNFFRKSNRIKNNGIDGNLLGLTESFLQNRYQRIALNGQSSKSQDRKDRFLDHFFLIYINDLLQGLQSDVKLFVDDILLLSLIVDVDASASKLNNALIKIRDWVNKWKMYFNPNLDKQTQDVIFFRK